MGKVFKNDIATMSPQFDGLANGCNHLALNEAGDAGQSVELFVENVNNDSVLIYYDVATKKHVVDPIAPEFTTTWVIPIDSKTLQIPTIASGTYDCDIDWGDGTVTTATSFDGVGFTHTYATEGTYIVNISGIFTRVYFNNTDAEDKLLSVVNFGTVGWTDLSYAFYALPNTVSGIKTGNCDTSLVTDMSDIFAYTRTSLDIGTLTTESVTDMSSMFYYTSSSLDVSGFDTSNVTGMQAMFYDTAATTIDVSSFDTSNVTGMEIMFKLTKATVLDVSGFNTTKVTNMSGMFQQSDVLTLDVSGFDTSNVTDTSYMFYVTPSVTTLDISGFDTSKVTNMRSMFHGTGATSLDVSNFNTGNVTNMMYMFSGVPATDIAVSGFNIEKVDIMTSLFGNGAGMTTANYDATLIAWEAQTVLSSVQVDFGYSQYTLGGAAETARTSLINNHNWQLTDGGGI